MLDLLIPLLAGAVGGAGAGVLAAIAAIILTRR